ncbi:hypothetical protein ACLOJK_015904 [Asimina triloba]
MAAMHSSLLHVSSPYLELRGGRSRGRGRIGNVWCKLGAPKAVGRSGNVEKKKAKKDVVLYSIAPLPLLFAATLPGAEVVTSAFEPFVELVKTWNLPNWLVHWGHPGNMAVVLFAMGGYGSYLGFRIRYSDDIEEKAKAKDLHPKLLGGMFFFFALGATGGITALLTSDKPIFESPHAVTGFIGLSLLTIQTILPSLFEVIKEIQDYGMSMGF